MLSRLGLALVGLVSLSSVLSSVALAQDPAAAAAADGTEPEGAPADQGTQLPWQEGPKQIDLGKGIALDLPANYDYLPMPEAGKVMESMGNLYNENLLGLVTSREEEAPWFITLRYDEEGYVKDDESVDGDELLEDMRDSLPEVNEEREAQGFPPIALDGWDEKPHYDKAKHHLVWCLRVSDKEGSSANYNTRVLGRSGHISINLVTDPARVATDKVHATALLGATRFVEGSRYEDFNADTDKVAEYGLAGLVAGGAGLGAMKLVKIGLLAKMWKVILGIIIAGKKAIILVLAGAAAGLKKLFSRSKGSSEQA